MLQANSFCRKNIRALYQYGISESRRLAHGVKEMSDSDMERSARMLAKITPRNAMLIPIPNRCGYAKSTLELCNKVAQVVGCGVADILEGNERQSLWEYKMQGKSLANIDLGIRLKSGCAVPANAYLVDNIYDTGTTYRAAVKACGVERMLTIAVVNKNDAEILFKENKQMI